MAKKQKKTQIDPVPKNAASLCKTLLECAECLDGKEVESCQHKDRCDEYVMSNVVEAVEVTEQLQSRMGEKAAQIIRGKANGFKLQNAITNKYVSKPSIALAETATTLRNTIAIAYGEDQ